MCLVITQPASTVYPPSHSVWFHNLLQPFTCRAGNSFSDINKGEPEVKKREHHTPKFTSVQLFEQNHLQQISNMMMMLRTTSAHHCKTLRIASHHCSGSETTGELLKPGFHTNKMPQVSAFFANIFLLTPSSLHINAHYKV